jgi:hypothetical protein
MGEPLPKIVDADDDEDNKAGGNNPRPSDALWGAGPAGCRNSLAVSARPTYRR